MSFPHAMLPLAAGAVDTVIEQVGRVLPSGETLEGFGQWLAGEDEQGERVEEISQVEDGGPAAGAPLELTAQGREVERKALRQQFDQLRESLHEVIVDKFAARGVDLSEPVMLKMDQQGRMLEDSGHWDRAAVEELLARDPALRSQFQQLMQMGEALWGSGPAGPQREGVESARLAVNQKEILFQIV